MPRVAAAMPQHIPVSRKSDWRWGSKITNRTFENDRRLVTDPLAFGALVRQPCDVHVARPCAALTALIRPNGFVGKGPTYRLGGASCAINF